jgi:hypothetical protein
MRERIRKIPLAKNLGVTTKTVENWVKSKILPPPRYLKGTRIPFWFADEIPGDKQLKQKS